MISYDYIYYKTLHHSKVLEELELKLLCIVTKPFEAGRRLVKYILILNYLVLYVAILIHMRKSRISRLLMSICVSVELH